MEKPTWAVDLDVKGLYYEGIVDDSSSLLDRYKASTLTTYGTRRSRKTQPTTTSNKDQENVCPNKEVQCNA